MGKKNKTCRECGAAVSSETRDHKYIESGLETVWIENATFRVCDNGHESLAIPMMGRLHRAIALAIVNRNAKIAPAEVRYLRKHLGLSNEDFATVMGVSKHQSSRWANSEKMGDSAERLLRTLVRDGAKPEAYPIGQDHIEYLMGLDYTGVPGRIRLRRGTSDWRTAAA